MTFVSPVFFKEMLSLARRRRYYFARAALLALLLTVIAIAWLNARQSIYYMGYADLAYFGRQLFNAFSITQFVAILLIVPALTAPVVAAEKKRDTLGLLMMTNLRPVNVLLDKLLSRLALIGLLLFATLPLFFVLLTFGGVTAEQIGIAYMCILGTILVCAGVGLWCSTMLGATYTAMMGAYAAIAGYVALVVLLVNYDLLDESIGEVLLPIAIFNEDLSDSVVFLSLSAVFFLLALLVCLRQLPKQVGKKRRHLAKRLFVGMNNFFRRINFTGIEIMRESHEPDKDALLWKETHKRFYASTPFLIRTTYTIIAVSLIGLAFVQDFEFIGALVVVLGYIVLHLLALVAGTAAFAGERENRSLEVLLAAPVPGSRIVLSKLLGILRLMVPIVICMVIWGALGCCGIWHDYWRDDGWSRFLAGIFALLSYVPLLIVIGLHASAKHRGIAGALLRAFVVALIWVALPILLAFAESEWCFWPGHHDIEEWMLSVNPVTGLVMLLEDDFSISTFSVLIPTWITLLVLLCVHFDKLVGRR